MGETDNDFYKTSDTALSAYLVSEGFGSPDLEFPNGSRAYFVFSRENSKITTAIKEFETARAIGNIVLFFNAYQHLLRRIRERY